MNTAYAPQSSPPHDMHLNSRIPVSNDGYRPAAPGAPQYHMPHTMSMPLIPPPNAGYPIYNQQQPPISQPPLPDSGHPSDGLVTLAPGEAPAVPEPKSRSMIEGGKKYELVVQQQPQRARMCGFGDKDRRPITPPPCVRLKITDMATGKEVDCNEIDHGMFVLNVDLWDDKGQRELNLVRNTGTSPSISAGVTVSYAQTEAAHLAYSSIMPQNSIMKFEQNPPQGYNPYPAPPNVNPYSQPAPYPSQYQHNYPPQNGNQYPPQNGYSQPSPGGYYSSSSGGMHTPIVADYPPPSQQQYSARPYAQPEISHQQPPRMAQNNGTPQGMFTRNLIGSLAASAFRLTDPDDRIGIWFVLQDLSVRTEGNFRLRFSFVNVGLPASPTNSLPSGAIPCTSVNKGKAPVLASCFSEKFSVFSAKKFPGVVESTPLSKCFATQGIKIPIRKEGPSNKGGKDDNDDD